MTNGRQGIASVPARLVLNLAAPVLVYLLLRPRLHNDITALVIGAAIPVAYTAVVFVWRRHVGAIGVVAIVWFVIGPLLAVAAGGDEPVFNSGRTSGPDHSGRPA